MKTLEFILKKCAESDIHCIKYEHPYRYLFFNNGILVMQWETSTNTLWTVKTLDEHSNYYIVHQCKTEKSLSFNLRRTLRKSEKNILIVYYENCFIVY